MTKPICPECGESFEPKAPNQTYCSAQHAKRAERRRYKQRKRQTTELIKAVDATPASNRRQYTDEDIELGLRMIVLAGGSPTRAARAIKQELGRELKASTLAHWRRTHPERYATLRSELEPRMKERRAEEHEAVADRFAEVAIAALDDLDRLRREGKLTPSQLSSLMHNASVDAGIHRDKAAKLRGENVTVIEHRSDKEIIDKLKRMGIIIDGEAEEVK